MRGDDGNAWMLAEAADLLQSVNRLGCQYLRVGPAAELLCWEPPVDMHQRNDELGVVVALPGVAPDRYTVALDHDTLVVRGERARGVSLVSGVIVHLEIPYGRFERRIRLPEGAYRIVDTQLEYGCLRLHLVRTP